jgi:hypothetical protein
MSFLPLLLLAACAQMDPETFWWDYEQARCERNAECAEGDYDLEACLENQDWVSQEMTTQFTCDYPLAQAEACLEAIATWPCDDDPSTNPECDAIVETCE